MDDEIRRLRDRTRRLVHHVRVRKSRRRLFEQGKATRKVLTWRIERGMHSTDWTSSQRWSKIHCSSGEVSHQHGLCPCRQGLSSSQTVGHKLCNSYRRCSLQVCFSRATSLHHTDLKHLHNARKGSKLCHARCNWSGREFAHIRSDHASNSAVWNFGDNKLQEFCRKQGLKRALGWIDDPHAKDFHSNKQSAVW